MKALYWKTRSFRRTAQGGRRIHWPGLALNVALAFTAVAFALGGLALADLDGKFAELFGLADALLPIIATWALALAAVGLGYRLTVPADRLPDEHGAAPAERASRWFHLATLRAAVFGVLASATMLFVCFTVSSWAGRHAWETYRADALRRGVVFELEKLMPPKVPDDQNFAETPLLRARRSVIGSQGKAVAGHLPPKDDAVMNLHERGRASPNMGSWLLGERDDLAAWQTYFRASTNFPKSPAPQSPVADVLTALTRWDAEIAELREAVRRPKTWFDVKLTEDGISTTFPNFLIIRTCVPVVQLRAEAKLAAGQGDAAFADAILALEIGDRLKDEPVLVAHLVRIAVYTVGLRTLWEGLADHHWTDAQLAHWQAELGKRDFAAELRHAMAGERAFGDRLLEFLTRRPEMLPAIGGPDFSGAAGGPAYHMIPSGWFYRERINYHRAFDTYIVPALPVDARRLDAVRIQAGTDAMLDDIQRNKRPIKAVLQHRVMTYLLLPALHKTMQRTCQAQAMTQLAIGACALERHRLARGSYPDSLAALAREFGPVPTDPMSGQPFGYERTVDGRFRLWSVGWNGKDDGGTVALREPVKKEVDFDQGDWVWPLPKE